MKDTLGWRLKSWSGYQKISELSIFYKYIIYNENRVKSLLYTLQVELK